MCTNVVARDVVGAYMCTINAKYQVCALRALQHSYGFI